MSLRMISQHIISGCLVAAMVGFGFAFVVMRTLLEYGHGAGFWFPCAIGLVMLTLAVGMILKGRVP